MFVAKHVMLQRKPQAEAVHFSGVELHDEGVRGLHIHVAHVVLVPLLDPVERGKQTQQGCHRARRRLWRTAVEMQHEHWEAERKDD